MSATLGNGQSYWQGKFSVKEIRVRPFIRFERGHDQAEGVPRHSVLQKEKQLRAFPEPGTLYGLRLQQWIMLILLRLVRISALLPLLK